MALALNSETRMVRDTAHAFFKERAPITALRKLRDTNDPDGFSRALWREMAELGWTGFLVPEDHGGTEFGVTGLAQVMEAAGRTLAASPLLSTALIGASLLSLAGSEDQKAEHLPPLVAGERLFALALEEGTRHQPYRIGAKVENNRLNGQKVFVLDGHVADVLIVAVRTSGGPGDREGIIVVRVRVTPGASPGTRNNVIPSRSPGPPLVRAARPCGVNFTVIRYPGMVPLQHRSAIAPNIGPGFARWQLMQASRRGWGTCASPRVALGRGYPPWPSRGPSLLCPPNPPIVAVTKASPNPVGAR